MRRGATGKGLTGAVTPRQQAFVCEYLKDFNATKAAIRAGYSGRGARGQAARMLTNAAVAQMIGAEQERLLATARVDSDHLQREAERIAVNDVRKLVRGGELLPIAEIPDDIAPAIASIEVVTKRAGGGEIEHVSKVRFWNKNDAIKTLFQLRGDRKVNEKNVNIKSDLTARYEDNKARALRIPLELLEEYMAHGECGGSEAQPIPIGEGAGPSAMG